MNGSSYAVVTPAHNEADHLPRLAEALARQTLRPAAWIIVDDSSTDATRASADRAAREASWIHVVTTPPSERTLVRGTPVVRAFHAGLDVLDQLFTHESMPDLVAKVDADVAFDPDYFARLSAAFAADERLGIASGSCYQLEGDEWRQFHGTGANVWGAARAYRWRCLEQILPLEPRMGWDGIDVAKANARGWRTATLLDLPFRHYRREASRESGRWRAWALQGDAAHYMGYRPTYVLARTSFRVRRDPAAVAMVWAYASAAARRAPRSDDAAMRSFLRRTQRMRELPARRREAYGEAR